MRTTKYILLTRFRLCTTPSDLLLQRTRRSTYSESFARAARPVRRFAIHLVAMRHDSSSSLLRAKPSARSGGHGAIYGSTKTTRRNVRRFVIAPIAALSLCVFLYALYRQTVFLESDLGFKRGVSLQGPTLETPRDIHDTTRSKQAAAKSVRQIDGSQHGVDTINDTTSDDSDDEGTPEDWKRAAEELLDKLKWVLPEEPPAPPLQLTSGAGDFPRPSTLAHDKYRTMPGGDAARSGAVPDGGWFTVPADPEKRDYIKSAMVDAYDAYEKYAFGWDELRPLSKRGKNAFGGLGASVIDSLDTLWIMGLSDHYSRARNWVDEFLYFDREWEASVFETTIRVLGGLLAAYDLSGDTMYVDKCLELAERLEPAFKTKTGVPVNIVNLKTGEAKTPPWTGGPGVVVLSEFGSLAMEFGALSERVGNSKWVKLAEKPVKVALEHSSKRNLPKNVPEGLYPLYFDSNNPRWTNSKVSVGAMGDSWYEYLLKVWVQGGRTEAMKGWFNAWEKTARGILDNLLVYSDDDPSIAFVGSWNGGQVIQEMDHLSCFVGGMFCLGSGAGVTKVEKEYLLAAKRITKTCYKMYHDTPSGIAPETIKFQGGTQHVGERQNIQRPEAIESIFYMYRKTGDSVYREWAWEIFLSMEKMYKTETGWSGLRDIRKIGARAEKDDLTQSFFFAETMKYFYLIFSDSDVIHLDEWVFNTEAHPLRVKHRKETIVK